MVMSVTISSTAQSTGEPMLYDVRKIFEDLAQDMVARRERYVASNKLVLRELHNALREKFFLAIEPIHQKRALIIPVQKPLGTTELKRFPTCRGTAVTMVTFDRLGPLNRPSCLMIAQTSSETAIYEAFIDNLCENLWDCGSADILPTVRKVMQKWQSFFSRAGGGGLTPEQRRGLFGELSTVVRLLDKGCHAEVVDAWKGPRREDVDFLFGPVGLEVKTTLLHHPLQVTIATENQLACVDTPRMFLVVLPIRVSDHSGQTLSEIVGTVRELLREWPLSLDDFESLLLDAGYHDKHAGMYTGERFEILDRRYYSVETEFPRIVAEAVPKGIVHVRYDILLDMCGRFEVNELDVIKAVQET